MSVLRVIVKYTLDGKCVKCRCTIPQLVEYVDIAVVVGEVQLERSSVCSFEKLLFVLVLLLGCPCTDRLIVVYLSGIGSQISIVVGLIAKGTIYQQTIFAYPQCKQKINKIYLYNNNSVFTCTMLCYHGQQLWHCVCLSESVHHKSVFYGNGRTNRAGFWYGSFLSPVMC